MANDRDGNPISTGDVFVIAGTVRRIEGDTIVIVLGSGAVHRVAAADVLPIDSLGGIGGTTDHNALSNLTVGDPHTQYVLANGSRAFSAAVAGVDPTLAAHLATKNYVDAVDTAIVSGTLAALAGKQDLDATLTALAGHTTAANKVTKWTGVDTCTTITVDSFGETMLATATAAAARTALEINVVPEKCDAPIQTIPINVTAYETLVSKTLTIASGDTVRIRAFGRIINNSGANRTYTWKATVGTLSVEFADGAVTTFGANSAPFRIEGDFAIKTTSLAEGTAELRRVVPVGKGTGAAGSANTYRMAWNDSTSDQTGSQTVKLECKSDGTGATQSLILMGWEIQHNPQRT